MRLKKIEIKGFKSFANRTTVAFVPGITCIVGPNGCGKSNITDAIKWVFGEQGTRALRAKKMSDIIFNGTEHRSSTNFAEVEITLEDWISPSSGEPQTLSIKRILYRSGESVYQINHEEVRLKDVRTLIMDTGMGISGYSIIGQGNIENILSDSKFDRRKIFEEASGISYLHYKKDETQRRLEKLETNLDRIHDRHSSMKKRIDPLRREAKKAIQYKELVERVKKIEYYRYNQENNRIERALESLESKIALQRDELQEQKQAKNDLLMIKNETMAMNKDSEDQREALERIVQTARKRQGETQQELSELEKMRIAHEHEYQTKQKQTGDNDAILIDLAQRVQKKKERLEQAKKLVAETQKVHAKQQRTIELLRDELSLQGKTKEERQKVISDKKIELERQRQYASDLFERKTKTIEKGSVEQERLKKLEEELLLKQEDAALIKQKLSNLEEDRKQISHQLKTLYDRRDHMKAEVVRAESEIEKLNHESSLLKNLEQSPLAKTAAYDSLKKSNHQEGISGQVMDLIKVLPQYEEAVQAALGGSIYNIVVKHIDDVSSMIEYIKRQKLGRVSFIPLDAIASRNTKRIKNKHLIGRAVDCIEFDKQYQRIFDYLLSGVYFANTIDDAIAYSKVQGAFGRIITLDGEIVQIKGKITGGQAKKQRQNVFTFKNRKSEIDLQKEKLLKEQKMQSKALRLLQLDLENMQQQKVSVSYQLNGFFNRNRDMEHEMVKLNSEIDHLKAQLDQENIEQITNKLADIESSISLLETEVFELENHDDDSIGYGDFEEESEQLTKLQIRLAELSKDVHQLTQEIFELEMNQASSKKKREEFSQQLQETGDILKRLKKEEDELREILANERTREKETKEELDQISNRLKGFHTEYAAFEQKQSVLDQEIDKLSKDLQNSEIEQSKELQKLEDLHANIWEKYTISFLQLTEMVEELPTEEIDQYPLLKEKMQKLSPVNFNAPKEYQMLKEDYDFLDEQLEDLLSSKRDLERTLKKIQKQMKEDFVQTFYAIRESYKETFSKLFRGGRGDIMLSDPNNELESDIEIYASPPGKKLTHLSLLSGGEKALTAIALLFAVLKTKPAPFYILDEIEAALDDVNIFSFGQFLQEFSKDSQFILITHRKPTMEFAKALYGVSMEEKGVSKIVSLELEESV